MLYQLTEYRQKEFYSAHLTSRLLNTILLDLWRHRRKRDDCCLFVTVPFNRVDLLGLIAVCVKINDAENRRASYILSHPVFFQVY